MSSRMGFEVSKNPHYSQLSLFLCLLRVNQMLELSYCSCAVPVCLPATMVSTMMIVDSHPLESFATVNVFSYINSYFYSFNI